MYNWYQVADIHERDAAAAQHQFLVFPKWFFQHNSERGFRLLFRIFKRRRFNVTCRLFIWAESAARQDDNKDHRASLQYKCPSPAVGLNRCAQYGAHNKDPRAGPRNDEPHSQRAAPREVRWYYDEHRRVDETRAHCEDHAVSNEQDQNAWRLWSSQETKRRDESPDHCDDTGAETGDGLSGQRTEDEGQGSSESADPRCKVS